MNECHLDKIVADHANGFTMVDIWNIQLPCEGGSSYGNFPPVQVTLNYPIHNLYTISQNIDEIVRNTTHNFGKQGCTSYNNIN